MYNYRKTRIILLLNFSWSNYYNFINTFIINEAVTESKFLQFCKDNFIEFQNFIKVYEIN